MRVSITGGRLIVTLLLALWGSALNFGLLERRGLSPFLRPDAFITALIIRILTLAVDLHFYT